MGGVAFDGVDGVGGVCVSGGRDARVGLRCCVSCMQVSFSGEVFWAGVVGEVVLSCRRSRGEGFQALHCRRLSLVFLFVFLCGCAGWRLLDGFLRGEVGGLRVVLMGARGGVDLQAVVVLCYISSLTFFCGLLA